MSIQTIINYDDPNNFTFPTDLITVDQTSAVAKLLLIDKEGEEFSQSFDNDAGFTYIPTLAEFLAGSVIQKDQTPANSVFGGQFTTKDLNWHKGTGGITGTLNGTPTFTGTEMQCFGSHGVYYVANTRPVESHKFKYRSNYSIPSTNRNMFAINNGTNNNDRFTLTHSPTADSFRITLYDSTGTLKYSTSIIGGAVGFTSGVQYEIELVIDSILGTVRVFINGNLHGTLSPGAWTRGTGSSRYYYGANPFIYNTANASFDDCLYFSNAQHTGNYTPGYSVPLNIYLTTKIDLPQAAYSGLGNIQGFTSFSATSIEAPRYIFNGLFWNGSAWAATSNTWATSSPIADILANIATLPASDTLDRSIMFNNTNTQQSISAMSTTYTGQEYPKSGPEIGYNANIDMDALINFDATVVGTAKYRFGINGVKKYISGGVLVNSDSTVQSNTVEEIQAAASGLDLSAGYHVRPYAVLISDGTTQCELSSIYLEHSFYVFPQPEINECIIYCFLNDIIQSDLSEMTDMKLIASHPSFVHSGMLFPENTHEVDFDSEGYAEISIIETESIAENISFAITGTINGIETVVEMTDAQIPDAISKNLVTISSIA